MIVENLEAEENFDDEILPDADRVAFGLRDTGYDFNTAIADIVDNSITAKATRVDITMSVDPLGDISVYITDNGHGMNQQELRNAMKYGSKEKLNKKSLSKFGLGLKTASTAFCRSLSLVSRGDDGVARKIQWDLDYIAQVNKWKPKTMEPSKSEMNILDSIAGSGTGTVVIWEKVDRLLAKGIEDYSSKTAVNKALKAKKDKLRYHLGVTFQRFLDFDDTRCPNIDISIDSLTNQNGTFNHKIEIVSGTKAGEMRILPVEDLEYGNLWKPCIADGKHAIKINQKHPFYQKVYYPVLGQNVMVTGMDALLWALAEAENSTVNPATEEYYEDMRTAVSKQLKKLLADLPDPVEE